MERSITLPHKRKRGADRQLNAEGHRPRRRNGNQFSRKKRPKGSLLITLREEEGSREVKHVNSFGPSISRKRGAKIRSSRKWIEDVGSPVSELNFPYLNQLGQFTGHTLFRWACRPSAFIASVISTVAKRLESRARKHNSHKVVNRNLYRLIAVSAHYAMSKDLYFWDRVLFFTKNLEKYGTLLHRLLVKRMQTSDVNERFVYSHACHQAQWLLFRAERPRDKSGASRSGTRSFSFLIDGEKPGAFTCASYLEDIAFAMSSI